MKITVNITYMEGYLPTPRSRKLRYKEVTEDIELEIREAELKDLVKKYSHIDQCEIDLEHIFYKYKGKLYEKADTLSFHSCEGKDWKDLLRTSFYNQHYYPIEKQTKEYLLKEAKDYFKNHLLVDGVLYLETGRPMYRIWCLGMGNNHGSTHLGIQNWNKWDKSVQVEAIKRAEVEKEALEIAKRRGDTKSFDFIRECPVINIF